jgi:hypothetical protein
MTVVGQNRGVEKIPLPFTAFVVAVAVVTKGAALAQALRLL